MKKILFSLCIIILVACTAQNSSGVSEEQTQKDASTLYFNGSILTMEGEAPSYIEAVVTESRRIVFTGAEQAAREKYGRLISEFDLTGATMIPGLIDSHVHLTIDAKLHDMHRMPEPWKLKDDQAFLSKLQAIADETPNDEWIILWGYDKALVPPNRNLTKIDLDGISDRHPIYVLYLGMHWASVNSLAMEKIGITRATPTNIPGGGIFFKDEEGEPTGLLTESAVYGILEVLNELVPPEQLRKNYFTVARGYNANGITTVADLASGADGGIAELKSLQAMANDPYFSIRLSTTPMYQILSGLEGPIDWDGNFQAKRIKLLIDASFVGGTAATFAPNLAGTSGNFNYTQQAYTTAIREAMAKGFSVATHTMGDRAHAVLLDSFVSVQDEFSNSDFRHGLEHSPFIQETDIARIADLGFSVSTMPSMIHIYGDALRDTIYGPEMTDNIFPNASLEEAGINLAIHSDGPITSPEPLLSAWSAVARETYKGNIIGSDHVISPYTAMKAITINAAYHLDLENEIGSIKPGKLADFVILDKDPLVVDPDEIRSIKVLKTIKGGTVVYSTD